jgi:glycosyltransferase involved in cell wall biosynthesis
LDGSSPVGVEKLKPPADPSVPPLISLVTVSFNQAQYLETCIRSVLDQNYPNLEYIVVDGGSNDGSVAIIEKYQKAFKHIIIEPDNGQSDALNKGFRLASGEIMNWLCSDDALMPGALEHVARAFRQHDADLIVGGCTRIRETSADVIHLHHSALPLGRTVRLDPYDILKFMRSWQKGNYFFQPEVFFSRRIWQSSGAYVKEWLHYAMDYDLWLRMALAGASARAIASPIAYSRVHALQKTRDDAVYLHQLRVMMEEFSEMFDLLIEASPAPAEQGRIDHLTRRGNGGPS